MLKCFLLVFVEQYNLPTEHYKRDRLYPLTIVFNTLQDTHYCFNTVQKF